MTSLAVGIDVGGTKIAAGLVNVLTGEVMATLHAPTDPQRGGSAVLADCVEMAASLLSGSRHQGGVVIGLGVPELVDPRGRVRSDFQFNWLTTDLRSAFFSLGVPRVESDVRAGALAEATFGAARGERSALYVSIGTGISCCFVIDGTPWLGRNGNALVLASGPTTVVNPVTGDATTQVMEEVSAGPALVARFVTAGGKADSAEDVLRQATSGNVLARRVVSTGAQMLGNAIGQVVNVLDPDLIVLGGGLGLTDGLYREAMVAAVRSTIWSVESRDIPIVPSQLGTSAGMVGAALSAWRQIPAGVM